MRKESLGKLVFLLIIIAISLLLCWVCCRKPTATAKTLSPLPLNPTEKEDLPFFDEHGNIIDHENVEIMEQLIAKEFIPADACVLELGGRYGTVSCAISRTINDSRNLVVIEPDVKVLQALQRNRDSRGFKFHIVHGTVSKEPMKIEQNAGYATTFSKTNNSTLPNYSYQDLQKKFNIIFDTLVVDCEGCFEQFLVDNKGILENIKLVTFETDMPHRCNYDAVRKMIIDSGFKILFNSGMHEVWKKLE